MDEPDATSRFLGQLARLQGRLRNSRDKMIFEAGLRLAHAEEAIASGDLVRAKAHLDRAFEIGWTL